MSENFRQFTSLDYADADMYGALTSKPTTATPLNLPLENFADKTPSTNADPLQLALNREDEVRRRGLFEQQRNQQTVLEQGLREREIARNLALQATQSKPIEQPIVSSRDYENNYRPTPSPSTRTSPATPPPTPNTSSARASSLIEPTQSPPPATPRQIMPNQPSQLQFDFPSPSPQMGRLLRPGIGVAAVDLGARLIIGGQPITQALPGALLTTAGSLGGALLGGAVAGPPGAFVGSLVGGLIGGYISDMFFRQQIPSPATPQPTPVGVIPFTGGQLQGVYYRIFIVKYNSNGQPIESRIFQNERGVIVGFKETKVSDTVANGILITTFNTVLITNSGDTVLNLGDSTERWRTIECTRMDGELDVRPAPPIPAPPPDNRPGYYNDPPLNADTLTPTGEPSQGQPRGQQQVVSPSKPSGGTARGDGGDWIPSGYLSPGLFPNPDTTPSNLGGGLPSIAPGVINGSGAAPGNKPIPPVGDRPAPRNGLTITPSTGGVVIPVPSEGGVIEPTLSTFTPATVTPSEGTDALGNTISSSDTNAAAGQTPTSIPATAPSVPISDGLSSTPKEKTFPAAPSPVDNQAAQQQKKDVDEQIAKLTFIATAIAALTPAINGIPDAIANSPNVRAATQGAVCEIAQPGGCLGNALDNSANKVNQNNNQNTANLLDKINAGANAAQLALLDVINNKLGAQLPGGISGKLTRFAQWAHLDRALNIMTFATTVHNGAMLSNNLGQTLLSVIGNLLSIVGLKDAEGQAFDIGSVISKGIEGLIKSAIGEENYKVLNSTWKNANRIYQATANLLNAVQSIGASVLNALEVVGQWNAKIGNALKRFGTVGERAYAWMNPNVNFQNKYFTALEGVTNVVSQVDQVASEVLSIKETVGQITNLKKEIDDSLKETDASKQKTELPEAAKLVQKENESKAASAALPLAEDDKEADEDE